MKIFFVTNLRLPNERGVSYGVTIMCHSLAQAGPEVELVAPKCRPTAEIGVKSIWEYHQIRPKLFKITNLPHLEMQIPHLTYFLMAWSFSILAVYHLIKNKAKIVHVFNDAREVLLILRIISFWFRPKIVFELHVRPSGYYDELLENFSISVTSLLLVTTQEFGNHYEQLGFPKDKILVFPNGVNINDFDFKNSKINLRKELNLPEKSYIVGYGGRFVTLGMEKGIPELIEAVKVLRKKHSNLILVCVGGPDNYVTKYRLEAGKKDIFIGDVPRLKMYKYLKTFDICAMPFPNTSHFAHNMSPLKTFEYMATGNPIVATYLPTIEEILTDQKNALLVRPGNISDLVKKIEMLIINPMLGKRLAANAKKEASSKYSWISRAKAEIRYLMK